MSEEEKKALDILINEIADIVVGEYCTHCKICENEATECYYLKTIVTVNNLIDKQQKEIELLKEEQAQRSWVHIKENGEVEPIFYISKDKIKRKIKELQENPCSAESVEGVLEEIDILKKLLEE